MTTTTATTDHARATAIQLGWLTAMNRRNGNHDTAALIAGQTLPEHLSKHPSSMTATLMRDFLDEYDRTLLAGLVVNKPGPGVVGSTGETDDTGRMVWRASSDDQTSILYPKG